MRTRLLAAIFVSFIFSGCGTAADNELLLQGAKQLDEGQTEQAALSLSSGLEQAAKEGAPEKGLGRYRLLLTRCYIVQGKIDEADRESSLAFQSAQKLYGKESPELVPYLLARSRVAYRKGDFAQSRNRALDALSIQEKSQGKESKDQIDTIDLIVSAACADDRCADTEPYLERQLALRKKFLGEDHPHVASSLCLLGELAEKKNQLEEAEKYYSEALAIREKSAKELVESTRKNLVRLHLKKLDE
ncbi:MAG: tetratricopeptide repeat protein [Candidatus Obscuribacterales bacterium]